MAYFNELPNLEYISPFDDNASNKDFIKSKNIFLRAKLNSNILSTVSAIQNYYVKDGERPDTIAEKIYEDSELDWVILITNNITNINDQWPLDNTSFYKYLLEKYGSDENIYGIHHYETTSIKDKYNRTILDDGFQVDPGFTRTFTTTETTSNYSLPLYQNSNLPTTIKINLNQFLEFIGRDYTTIFKINKIEITSSKFDIPTRNGSIEISIENTLFTWPEGWGGRVPIKLRNGEVYNLPVGDEIGDTFITLPEYLYELVRTEINNEVDTKFVFTPQI